MDLTVCINPKQNFSLYNRDKKKKITFVHPNVCTPSRYSNTNLALSQERNTNTALIESKDALICT